MKLIYLTAGVLCLHPMILWMSRRAIDGSDDPWGIVSLVVAIGIVVRAARRAQSPAAPRLWLPALAYALYGASLWWLSPLPRALLGTSALALLCMSLFEENRFNLGLFVLFLLGLPLMASLQFYGGYPLRVVVAELACCLLRFSGDSVTRVGVNLELGGQIVSVDAACSGLKMLWTGGVAAAWLVAWNSLTPLRALGALVSAAAILILANVLRASALFKWAMLSSESAREQSLSQLPLVHLVHSAVGLVLFALAVIAIQQSTQFFQRHQVC